jgi:hypothetical protein
VRGGQKREVKSQRKKKREEGQEGGHREGKRNRSGSHHLLPTTTSTTVVLPSAPPASLPGQPTLSSSSSSFLVFLLHYFASEQWRVNYNSLSSVHVACEQWRVSPLFTWSDQFQLRPKWLGRAWPSPIKRKEYLLGLHQPNPGFGPMLAQLFLADLDPIYFRPILA